MSYTFIKKYIYVYLWFCWSNSVNIEEVKCCDEDLHMYESFEMRFP